ncbi:MAG TPA: TIR domain-containing protein [Blastocatellia bacterium]|nr:TIR domain-containing protein [Blastocatellia bacterium]
MPNATILITDDNVVFLDTLREKLERVGYFVKPAKTYREAERIVETGVIDLAIIDLKLDEAVPADRSGLKLAKWIGRRQIPVIILTGYPSVEAVRDALGATKEEMPPAVDFLEKEGTFEPLLREIRRRLSSRRAGFASDVFIVHGHDPVKDAVARCIEGLGLKVVILSEQPHGGRTIIEQIERHSEIGYVVVLLTPDDVGHPKRRPKAKRFRARQNVIFELGYFMAKPGRKKVCSLYKDGVELPTDVDGVIYIPLDSGGGWKLELAKNLRAAGLPIEMNDLVNGRRR